MSKDLFLKILIVSYIIRVAITFSSLPYCVAEDGSATKTTDQTSLPFVAYENLLRPYRQFFYLCLRHFKSISLSTLFPRQLFQ